MPSISQRKLDVWRRYWQKTLRLQDWKIKVKFVDQEILGEECLGTCEHLAEARAANISLLPLSNLIGEDGREQDIENTLVHELLHCHFAPFRTEDPATQLQHEQAIEAIAEALLTLNRKIKKKRNGK